MSDFAASWTLSRSRFDAAIEGLNHQQLNWRLQDGVLTLAQMAVHVAGVEVWFASQMLGESLGSEDSRLTLAATDGVVNEKPFPYADAELTPEFVAKALQKGRDWVGRVVWNPSEEVRRRTVQSALGPVIDGEGALARLGFHAGYHQGQAHILITAPGFPR